MNPSVRKVMLTAHVVLALGWFGAVLSFLALGIFGLAAHDAGKAHAAYVAMDLTGWFVIVPLAFTALTTGLIQGLGTPWGLVRHYWTLMKLLITALCTVLLLVHMRPTARLAAAPMDTLLLAADLQTMRLQLVVDAALALGALAVAAVLAIYKPAGATREGMPRWFKLLGAIGIAALLIGRIFAGHGPHGR
jgi:hypothetical protein